MSTAGTADPVSPKDAAQALAEKFAQDGQSLVHSAPAVPAAAAAKPERPPLDYEMDMLRRARAEAASQGKTVAPAAAAAAVPPAPPVVNKSAVTTQTPSAPPAIPTPPMPVATTTPATPPPQPAVTKSDDAATAAQRLADTAPHATVLLVLQPERGANGSRPAPPDPLICVGAACYVSLGLDTGATTISRSEALALKSTDDVKANACKGKSGCIFRDIPVPPGSRLEILDAGGAASKKRDAGDVSADATCKINDGDLECNAPATAVDYRVWIVPEEIARKAGVTELEEVVADGLPEDDETAATDK